jgi:dihydroorotate dehydrogenase
MYKLLIRPILFTLPPEKIHDIIVSFVRFFFHIPGFKLVLRSFYSYRKNETYNILGLSFPSRVGLAAGFDKNALFYQEFSVFGFGFIEIGTVTPVSQPGNPKPRSFRLPDDEALINRMGFNNYGVDEAVKRLKNRPSDLIIGGNIGKNTLTKNIDAVNDYEYCFNRLYDHVDYFVVNVSCPNISDLKELQDQEMLEGILTRLSLIRDEKSVIKPVLLKISPDLNFRQIDETLKIINDTGIDGIVATNTTITRDNLQTNNDRVREIGQGGLSGKPLRDRSTEIIRYIREKAGTSLPIIGVGGIMSEKDALEKINAGANLVQVYTGFIYEGPGIVKRINKAINRKKGG